MSLLLPVHIAISLIAIASGAVVMWGFLNANQLDGWTGLFLATTVLTSVSGFLFPFHGITPGDVLGIISLVALGLAILARYRFRMEGAWRKIYVITAVLALYLNCFVLVVQLFRHVPALTALAPTQSEPPFAIAQVVLLVAFAAFTILALSRFAGQRAARAQHS